MTLELIMSLLLDQSDMIVPPQSVPVEDNTDGDKNAENTNIDGSESSSESSSESGSESGADQGDQLDMDSDEVHNEVADMLTGTGPQIIELISLDPKRYLDIVQRYSKMKDGREIYLPHLFNILVRRENGNLRIKFKLTDNSQWHEVGYEGDMFTDEDVYKAFREKVIYALKRPHGAHREYLIDMLKDDPKPKVTTSSEQHDSVESDLTVGKESKTKPTQSYIVSQGDQEKITNIDRFMGRVPTVTFLPECLGGIPAPAVTTTAPTLVPMTKPASEPMAVPVPTPTPTPMPMAVSGPTSPDAITHDELYDELERSCQTVRQLEAVLRLRKIVFGGVFQRHVVDMLPKVTKGERCLLIDLLDQFE